MSGRGAPYWVQKEEEAILRADRQSVQLKLEGWIKELEADNSRLRESRPICKCQNCGSEFTVRPYVGQDSVASHAERLLKVTCFKCGADAGRLTVSG